MSGELGEQLEAGADRSPTGECEAKCEMAVIYNEAGEEVFIASETPTHRILIWKKQ